MNWIHQAETDNWDYEENTMSPSWGEKEKMKEICKLVLFESLIENILRYHDNTILGQKNRQKVLMG